MTGYNKIFCKDCGEPFLYSEEAAARDRIEGRSPPERCIEHRDNHKKEIRTLGLSHYPVLQLRENGSGGLAHYVRNRPNSEWIPIGEPSSKPLPIDEIIGKDPNEKGKLLHGLLHDRRQVHLVVGPTGSGKSTWLPYRLLKCPALLARGCIAITQPRIPATVGPAEFVAQLYSGIYSKEKKDIPIGPGTVVGYRYSDVGRSMTDPANRMIFMTDGTLLNELKNGKARSYGVVMIDEAHERSDTIDKILALLRQKVVDWPHLQVIIASATVNAKEFEDYFGGNKKVATYVSEGFTYPILEVYSDESVAHWPYLSWNKDEKIFLDASGTPRWPEDFIDKYGRCWDQIPDKEREAKYLGPVCYKLKNASDNTLRYYPQFEVLVYQGVMEETIYNSYCNDLLEGEWSRVIGELHERSHRKRSIGKQESDLISLNQSIRGKKLKPPEVGQFPRENVKEITRERLRFAIVDAVLDLVKWDDQEALRRQQRWNRWREHFGWLGLNQPADKGHILAFLPTSREIDEVAEIITKKLKEYSEYYKNNKVLRYYSKISDEEKKQVEAKSKHGEPRRIIIGSNLAETSLTLDGLVYVIDSGLICEEYFDSESREKKLLTIPHSRSGCRQRVGRVGRKEPGEAYRLYTREELLKQHRDYTIPAIARVNTEAVLLQLIHSGLPPDPKILLDYLMTQPDKEEFHRAFGELQRVNALDKDGDLTALGEELSNAGGESFFETQLLTEADRHGILWEMAIFLEFTKLQTWLEAPAPAFFGNKNPRWSVLWDDQSSVYYSDSDEPPDDNDDSSSQKKRENPWDKLITLANGLRRHAVLAGSCLDDLEFYLRLWQGWFPRSEDDRKKWAQTYGINHAALINIERDLGLETKNQNLGKNILDRYYASEDKGIQQRDVNFTRLDLVRFLLVTARPDRIFQRDPIEPALFRSVAGNTENDSLAYAHPESTWANYNYKSSSHWGNQVERSYCVATTVPYSSGKKPVRLLRHMVWVDPKWLRDGGPSFIESPLRRSKRLLPLSQTARTFLEKYPFVTGADLAQLPPESDIPQPLLPLPKSAVLGGSSTVTQATVTDDVDYPWMSSKRMIFIRPQNSTGKADTRLVPLCEDSERPAVVSDTDLYKVEIFVDHQSHELRARIIEYPPPATVPTTTCLSSSTPTELPTDTPVEATVVELLTNEGFWGFLAHVGGQPKANLRVDCPLRLEVLQQEAKIGRQLRIIVKPRSNPSIPFYYGRSKTLEWLDGEVPLPNDFAEVNVEFETVVCGPVANRFDLVEIEPPEDLPLHLRQLYKKKKWWANIKSIPRGMAKGTKVRAKITGWKEGNSWKEGNTFPTIKILKILETPTGSV